LKSFPLHPYQNNIYYHEGNPPISYFGCTQVDNAATFLASWTGTTLSVINITSGVVGVGNSITGIGLATGTKISAVVTAEGHGTYTLSANPTAGGSYAPVTLVSSAQVIASWSTSSTIFTVSAVLNGKLAVGQVVYGYGIASGTTVWRFISASGGIGTYVLSALPLIAGSDQTVSTSESSNITASWAVSSRTLTLNSVISGVVAVGQAVVATGIPMGTTIAAVLTGGFGLGTYTMSSAQLASGSGVVTATVGTCVVTDYPVSPGYVYPGIDIRSYFILLNVFVTFSLYLSIRICILLFPWSMRFYFWDLLMCEWI
jgi:hypothetical protein